MLDTVKELCWKQINYLLSNGSKTLYYMIEADNLLSKYLLAHNWLIQFDHNTHTVSFYNNLSEYSVDVQEFCKVGAHLIPHINLNVQTYDIPKIYVNFKKTPDFVKHVGALEIYYYWGLRDFPTQSFRHIYEYFFAYPRALPYLNPLLIPPPCIDPKKSTANITNTINNKNSISQEFIDKTLLVFPYCNQMTKVIMYTLKVISVVDLCVDPCDLIGIRPIDIDTIRKYKIPTQSFSIKQLMCDFINCLNEKYNVVYGSYIQKHKLWLYKIIYDEPYFFVPSENTLFNDLETTAYYNEFVQHITTYPDEILECAFKLKSFEFIKYSASINNYEVNQRIIQKIFSYDYLDLLKHFMKYNLFNCVNKSIFDSDLLYWLCVHFLDKYSFDITFFIMMAMDYGSKLMLWEFMIKGKYFDIICELYEMCHSIDPNSVENFSNGFGLGMGRFMDNFNHLENNIYDEINHMIGYKYEQLMKNTSCTETNYLKSIRDYEFETTQCVNLSSNICSYEHICAVMDTNIFFDYIRFYAPVLPPDTDTNTNMYMYDKRIFYAIFFDNSIELQDIMGKAYTDGNNYTHMGYILKKWLCVSTRLGSRRCFIFLLKKMLSKTFDDGTDILADTKKCIVKISLNVDLWFVVEMYKKNILNDGELQGIAILLNDRRIFQFANVRKMNYLLDTSFCLRIVKNDRLKLFVELFKSEFVFNNYQKIMEVLENKQDFIIYPYVVEIYNFYKLNRTK